MTKIGHQKMEGHSLFTPEKVTKAILGQMEESGRRILQDVCDFLGVAKDQQKHRASFLMRGRLNLFLYPLVN